MSKTRRWAAHVILLPISVLTLVPLLWIILTSLKDRTDVLTPVPRWLPQQIVWGNFVEAFFRADFNQYYLNTVLFTVGLLVVQLVTIVLAAYAFARMKFRGRDVLFIVFLTQMMITPQSLMLPNYLTVRRLGLLDTIYACMLPYCASASGTFLLRQAFKTIPQELEDAAWVDGCGGLRFLWHVGLHMVRPALLTFSMLSVVYHWNEFFWPLLVTNTAKSRVLTIGLALLSQQAESGAEWSLLMAATVIAILPMLLMFLLFQKRFVESFMHSGIKG